MRVVAQGRLTQRNFQDKEGAQRTAIELEIDEIGPSLRYATAQVTRAASQSGGGGGQQAPQQQPNAYAPPQGQQPQGYGPPQGQQPGYQPPQQQVQQQPQQVQQQPIQQQAPQQAPQQVQQQQNPWPGGNQPGGFQQPGSFGDQTPF